MPQADQLTRRLPLFALANLVAAAGGMLFQIVLSRHLAPGTFGSFIAILSLLYGFAQVFESYSLTIAREYSTTQVPVTFRSTVPLALIMGAGAITVLVAWGLLQSGRLFATWWDYLIASALLAIWSILWLLRGIAQGLQMERTYTFNRAVELLARLGIGVLLVAVAANTFVALTACSLGAVAAGVHLCRAIWKRRRDGIEVDTGRSMAPLLPRFIRMAFGFLPLALFIRLDMILAPQVLAGNELGAYAVLNSIGKPILLYSLALSPLLFPYLSRAERGRDSLGIVGYGSLLSLGCLTVAFIVVLYFGAGIIHLTFGSQYAAAAAMLPGYVLAMAPLAIHCNVINLHLARGGVASIVMLWMGLVVYGFALRFGSSTVTGYIAWIAAIHVALSAVALVVGYRLYGNALHGEKTLVLEAGVGFGDAATGRIEPKYSRSATLQIEGDRQPVR
jgi:O-antigen/teichoic acid export membrane protein